jgi:hypothetical protein
MSQGAVSLQQPDLADSKPRDGSNKKQISMLI